MSLDLASGHAYLQFGEWRSGSGENVFKAPVACNVETGNFYECTTPPVASISTRSSDLQMSA
jgi:hypothetical protein